MNLLNGSIRPMYFKYLSAAFDHIGVLHRGHGHGGPVPRAGGHGDAGGGGAGMEHHLQPWPFDGHWRQRHLQHKARQRYMLPIKYVFPLFLFNQMLAAVMRSYTAALKG